MEKFIYSQIEYTTAGIKVIIPLHCPFCQINTGGGHVYGCPNYQNQPMQQTLTTIDVDAA